MLKGNKILQPEDLKKMNEIMSGLKKQTKSFIILIVDDSGQLITSTEGDSSVDPILLGTLTAGNFGATNELARLIGESEFTLVLHEGNKENIHMLAIGSFGILVVIFGNDAPIGLIRMYSKKAVKKLEPILKGMQVQKEKNKADLPSDEDLDKLFNW
jgi:predicted regulator of Ras-like GTPase activity (Roadblock/LC7/MglB family)